MSTKDVTEVEAGSLAELFHLVGSLVPEGQQVIAAPPDMRVAEAIRLMDEHNFSQLPVVAGRAVLGVFSFRSLARRLLGMGRISEDFGDLPVDEFVEQFEFAQPSDNWESTLKHLDREDGVLVGHRDRLDGIVTPMDVLRYLCNVTSPFVMLAEIELSLRKIIAACATEDELRMCSLNSLARKYGEEQLPTSLSEMTFNDYVSIIGDGRNWPHFTTVFGQGEWQRKTTTERLKQVGELRNEVFHFRRELNSQDLDILTSRRDWLQMKARAFEARKAQKAGLTENQELQAEKPARKKWDEPSFFQVLHETRGAEEAAAARHLFDWAKGQRLLLGWGRGRGQGFFKARWGHARGPVILRVWTSGWVTVPFNSLQSHSPYDQEEQRRELLRRLNTVEGVNIDSRALSKEANIRLPIFVDGLKMQQLVDIVGSIVQHLSHAAGSGLVQPMSKDSDQVSVAEPPQPKVAKPRGVLQTEKAYWELLSEQAPENCEETRRLIERFRAVDEIIIERTKTGLAVRFEIPTKDVQVTIFFVGPHGRLSLWPGTSIRSQLARAGLDPELAQRYGDSMRPIMHVPKSRKEFNRNIGETNIAEFAAAAEAFIEEVRRAAADL